MFMYDAYLKSSLNFENLSNKIIKDSFDEFTFVRVSSGILFKIKKILNKNKYIKKI